MRNQGLIVSVTLLLLFIAHSAPAIDLQYESAFLFSGMPSKMAHHNGYLYGLGTTSLQILAIDSVHAPRLAGGYPFPERPADLSISGNHAYVAVPYTGLFILDLADPVCPRLSYSGGPDFIRSVFALGTYAYIAADSTFYIYDMSNPSSPSAMGSLAISSHLECVYVTGSRAIVGDSSGFVIIDVSNPSAPSLLGSAPTTYKPIAVWADSQYAYMLDFMMAPPMTYGGLRIFDISNPQAPVLVSSYDNLSWASGFDIEGDIAFIANGSFGLEILDITDRAHPVSIGAYSMDYGVYDVEALNARAFVSSHNTMDVIDISNPHNPDSVGSYVNNSLYIEAITIRGDYAYVAGQYPGDLQIVSIDDIHHLEYISSLSLGNMGQMQIDAASGYACIAAYWGDFSIINVQDPLNPQVVREVWSANRTDGVSVAGDYVYLSDGWHGVRILSLTDSNFVRYVEFPGIPKKGCISGSYFFLASYSGWVAIDISDPTQAFLAAQYITGGNSFNISTTGNYAFLAHGEAGISIWDITDPLNAQFISQSQTPGDAVDIVAIGRYAFVADMSDLLVVDISDIYIPQIVSAYAVAGYVKDLAVRDSLLFVLSEDLFQILSIPNVQGVFEHIGPPDEITLLQNYPNPFNARTTISYNLPKTSEVRLEVYDLLGRRVATLVDGRQDGGEHAVTWDAEDVPSGVYFYRLDIGERTKTNRCVLLK